MADRTSALRGVSVQVRELRKSFGAQPVLHGVDLDVGSGEIFVIMGPSGSGKTMLLRHVIGLEKPDAGDIRIDGHQITSGALLDSYRLAMVFQSGALLSSLTVAQNVGLYLSEHRLKPESEIARIVSEKLALVGLQGVESKFPSELSGGMTKRVAIARALVIDPQLILYDEPTSELDPLMAVTIAEQILDLRMRIGVTSLIVTHDRDLAFGIADKIAIIDAGKILASGTPAAIREHRDPLIQNFLTVELNRRIAP